MRHDDVRRYRGVADDLVGGLLTFVLEFAVVLGLGGVAFLVAVLVLALT